MFVIRLIGKIAALPLIVLTAIAGFLFNLASGIPFQSRNGSVGIRDRSGTSAHPRL